MAGRKSLDADTSSGTTMSVVIFLAIVAIPQGVISLRILEIQVPAAVLRGQPVTLNCTYDLEKDILYSIKWYKNNVEFYRYIPIDQPPGQEYSSRGIYLDNKFSQGTSIRMYETDLDSEGSYRCEVSAESFQTVMDEKEMRVHVLPDHGPTILGTKTKYKIGDDLNVTCMSGPSKPPSFLQWQVNGKEVPHQFITRLSPLRSSDGLLSSMLGLKFLVEPTHLRNGVMTLRCTAFIAKAYLITRSEIVATNKAKIAEQHTTIGNDSPRITGGKLRYQEGNVVNVNCTAAKAHPPSELRWYINDKEANTDYLRSYSPIRYPDGQESSVLGLRFTVKARHFQKSEMRLKCTATLFRVTSMRSEDMIISSRKQSSGLHVVINRHGRNDGIATCRRNWWLLLTLIILMSFR